MAQLCRWWLTETGVIKRHRGLHDDNTAMRASAPPSLQQYTAYMTLIPLVLALKADGMDAEPL